MTVVHSNPFQAVVPKNSLRPPSDHVTTATIKSVFGKQLGNDLADMRCRDEGSELPTDQMGAA